MSEARGDGRGAGTGVGSGPGLDRGLSRGLPPWAVLLCGALAVGFCLLLLFGPFYPYSATPGNMVQARLLMLSDGRGPRILSELLWNRFFLSTAVVLGVILILLPWRAAKKRQRSGGARGPGAPHSSGGHRGFSAAFHVSVTEHTTSLTFSDDGRIIDPEHPDAAMIQRSVSDLRMMALTAGIPWHTNYETSGGARAFLEVLRAQGTGTVAVHRAEDMAAESSMPGTPVPETAANTADDAATGTAANAAANAAFATSGSAETTPPTAQRPRGAANAGSARMGAEDFEPSVGSPSSTDSVYTPTTLYRSSTWDSAPGEEEQP